MGSGPTWELAKGNEARALTEARGKPRPPRTKGIINILNYCYFTLQFCRPVEDAFGVPPPVLDFKIEFRASVVFAADLALNTHFHIFRNFQSH